MLTKLHDTDSININVFGIKKSVKVICQGDNKFNDQGEYKDPGFELTHAELDCLNWLLENIRIEDYIDELVQYCNYTYEQYCDKQISAKEIKNEVDITHIAIIIRKEQDDYYPDIAFLGECTCDEDHGICIAFRNRQFKGISTQDWVL